MQLDTGRALGEIEPDEGSLRDAIVAIAQQSTDRQAEYAWASRLRLLAPAPLSDDSQGPSDVVSCRNEQNDLSEDSSQPGDEEYCSCQNSTGHRFGYNDRRLQLLNRDAVPECSHYLAVSYCWSSSERSPYHGDGFVVRSGSSERALKCPPALLDRMIRVCAAEGIRFIWIDQECIDQDDAEDKEVGILAMDLVYQFAQLSVGVLEVCLTEQGQVDILELMMTAELPGISRDGLISLIEVLELVAADPWFTRAWCLQEATSGSRKILLLLRHRPGLEIPEALDYGGNVALNLAQMNDIISSLLVFELDRFRPVDAEIGERGDQFIDSWFARNVPNVYPESDERDIDSHVVCSGTEAMWFLEKRLNSVISDRLGIMANLCSYQLPLRAKEVERDGHGFSIAALTLAILNGDISVLAGHYETKNDQSKKRAFLASDPPTTRGHGFSWCPPKHASLAESPFIDKDELVLRIDVLYLSDRGLRVKGCRWHADRELDLSGVRSRLRNRYGDRGLEEAIQPDNDGSLVSQHSVRVRDVRVAALMELICHAFVAGYRPLARQIWSTVRTRATQGQLAASDEVRAYNEAALESVIDIESRRHRWKNPIPKLSVAKAVEREDSFGFLQDGFAMALLTATIETGSLVIARPSCKDAIPQTYQGVFDTARLGDVFFAPRTNFGCETPYEQYGWYPAVWRLHDDGDGDAASCRGLVAGNWKFDEDCMTELYLV